MAGGQKLHGLDDIRFANRIRTNEYRELPNILQLESGVVPKVVELYVRNTKRHILVGSRGRVHRDRGRLSGLYMLQHMLAHVARAMPAEGGKIFLDSDRHQKIKEIV